MALLWRQRSSASRGWQSSLNSWSEGSAPPTSPRPRERIGESMKTALVAISLLMVGAPQQNPPLESVIEDVSKNVQELQNTLPGLRCDEKLVKNSLLNLPPSLDRSVTTRSVVMMTRNTRGGPPFEFSRQVQSVSGRSPMVDLVGMLTDDLFRTFAPQNLSNSEYKFARRQNLRGVPAFVIEFETRKGQSGLSLGGVLIPGGDSRYRIKGKAWVDSNTMQVLRLEIDEENPRQQSMRTVADYGAVQIAGKSFWLLTKIAKTESGGEWMAEYSDTRSAGSVSYTHLTLP